MHGKFRNTGNKRSECVICFNMATIYLDYAATTPMDPAVINCMYDLGKNCFGNPSSTHAFGQRSKTVIEKARKRIADAIGAQPKEIIFTAGGTESDNMALIGAAFANRDRGRHIITTRIEHPAVLETCKYLENAGFEITYLGVDSGGRLSIQQLEQSISDETVLISVMMANNETGVLFPIREIGEIIQRRNILFHSDCVQAFGRLHIDVSELKLDLLSLSAHKIYGPKGIGALYVRSGSKLQKFFHGGAQESGRRAGTENVPAIGGFAEAVEQLAVQRDERHRIKGLRDLLETRLSKLSPGILINGSKSERLYSHANIFFPNISGENLLMNLDINGIAISTGSACSSGSMQPSHVLTAMGLPAERVANSVRISLGRFTTQEEIEITLQKLEQVINRTNARVANDPR